MQMFNNVSSDQLSGKQLYTVVTYYMVVTISAIGLCCNVAVFLWLVRFRRTNPNLHPASAFLAMCTADSLALACLLTYNVAGEPFCERSVANILLKVSKTFRAILAAEQERWPVLEGELLQTGLLHGARVLRLQVWDQLMFYKNFDTKEK